jgi:hypothetical protein
MFDPPYALWSIWKELSTLQRLFVLTLGVVSVYCLASAFITTVRLRSTRNLDPRSSLTKNRSLTVLKNHCANVQQVITAAFYLFGFVLFFGMQNVSRTLGDGPVPIGMEVLGNFTLQCAFATNVFLVFLVLHVIRWFVCCRVNSFAVRVSDRDSQ